MCKGNLLNTEPETVLIQVEWSGYNVSESDELYHAVWSNTSGKKVANNKLNACSHVPFHEPGLVKVLRPSEVSSEFKFEIHSYNFGKISKLLLHTKQYRQSFRSSIKNTLDVHKSF